MASGIIPRVSCPRRAPLAVPAIALLVIALPAAAAQQRIAIAGDRLSGVPLATEPLDGAIVLDALQAWSWTIDDTKRLYLEGDVRASVAGHVFAGASAVVWINRVPTEGGVVNQIAIYFAQLDNPARPAGIQASGADILVTGAARGPVTLHLARLIPANGAPPERTSEVRAGEARLAEHLRRLLADPPRIAPIPRIEAPDAAAGFVPRPGSAARPEDLALPAEVALPDALVARPWLREPGAVLRVAFGEIELRPGESENAIVATSGIAIEYADPRRPDLGRLELAADRAVIFTDPGSIEEMRGWEIDATRVRGVYLEGDVRVAATAGGPDDEYVIRAPHAYYDFTTDQAILANAILRTYDRERRIPISARAEELRQVAADQWRARSVRVTTSEFHVGHLALGAERMTVTRRPAPGGAPETHFDAEDVTVRAGDLPFFYWPRFSGTVEDVPLRGAGIGTRDNDGLRIRTRWDLLSLLGAEHPSGLDLELKLDGYTKRGAAAGIEGTFQGGGGHGAIDLYGLYDTGIDRTSTGIEVEPDQEFRGIALAEHALSLGNDWSLRTQASYVSDESFVSTWRERDFAERRAYETSAYLKQQRDGVATTALVTYALNDFISNDWLLASQAYQVDKVGELAYRRIGESIFGDRATYTGETRVSRQQLVLEKGTPRDHGVSGAAFAGGEGVGLPPGGIGFDDSIEDAQLARGLRPNWVNRLDTRHEVGWPFAWSALRVVPFVVGRVTVWDDDFREYAGNEDQLRIFGGAGVRIGTQFQHVDDSVESRLFDLHRMRHVMEPSVTLWYAAADVSEDDLPVYDLDVESIATGAAVRVGVRNTWQTQRGGPGRWRSVDVFTLDADLVLTSGDVNREGPVPRWVDFRPEYSHLGDHVRAAGAWLLTDAMSLSGETTIDIDESAVARAAIGTELRHAPDLTTFIELRYLDAEDDVLLGVGWAYRITPKYTVSFSPQWDFKEDEFRSVSLSVVRGFPDFDLTVSFNYDAIVDDVSFGAAIDFVSF